jgi:hypothetical protein
MGGVEWVEDRSPIPSVSMMKIGEKTRNLSQFQLPFLHTTHISLFFGVDMQYLIGLLESLRTASERPIF